MGHLSWFHPMFSTSTDVTTRESIPVTMHLTEIYSKRPQQIYIVNSSDITQVPLFSVGARMPVRRVLVSCLINLSNYDVTR